MADLKESQSVTNAKAEEFEVFQDDDEFEEFEEDWGKKDEDNDDTLWDADWDDADVTDDFAKQLRAELERSTPGK